MRIKLISGTGLRWDDRVFILSAFLLLSVTCFLHLYRIGEVPNGFYSDESSVGYNAWCIAETGADEYGTKHPVFFKCFGNYNEPVMIYVLAPMIEIFGAERWVVRLPSAVFLILASVAFYFLASRYVRDRWICLVGAFLFSILPWMFPISRVGLGGYAAMLLGVIAGWYFLQEAMVRKSFVAAVIAGIFWAFAMYAHNIGRPMTAALLICFIIAFNVGIIKRWKVFSVFVGAYVASLMPMIVSVFNHSESMTSRFSLLCVWQGSSGIIETSGRMLGRYLEYFSPSFLFICGDSNLRHHSGASGELYVFMFPFVIAGIYVMCRGFMKNPSLRFAVLGLAIYPLAAIFTIDHMHSMRSLNGAVFWCMAVVIGGAYLWRERNIRFYRLMFYVLPLLAVYETASYMTDYFRKYAERSRLDFAAPLVEALEISFKNLKSGETLYVSASAIPQKVNTEFKPFWYAHLLFFGKVAPAVYQGNGIPTDRICAYQGKISGSGILLRNDTVRIDDGTGSIQSAVNDEPVPQNSELIGKIPIAPGKRGSFEIYKVR